MCDYWYIQKREKIKQQILENINVNYNNCPRMGMIELLSDSSLTMEHLKFIEKSSKVMKLDDIKKNLQHMDYSKESSEEDESQFYDYVNGTVESNEWDNDLLNYDNGKNEESKVSFDNGSKFTFNDVRKNVTTNMKQKLNDDNASLQYALNLSMKENNRRIQRPTNELKIGARNKTIRENNFTGNEFQYNEFQMKHIIAKIPPLFKDSLYATFIQEKLETDHEYLKLYTSWKLKRKIRPLSNRYEPRITVSLMELYYDKYGEKLDFLEGFIRVERLSDCALQYFKDIGLINKKFIYDHPYWWSREEIPFFLKNMINIRRNAYKKWKTGSFHPNLNDYDIEPRLWTNGINRRLTMEEMSQMKNMGLIHSSFEYDNEHWNNTHNSFANYYYGHRRSL